MAAQQQQNQSDDSMSVLWGVSAVFFALGVIWYVFKASIVEFYLHIKLWEIDHFLLYFFPRLQDARSAIVQIINSGADKVELKEVALLGSAVGDYLRYPLIIILFGLAAWVYFKSSTRIFKNIYSTRELANLEKSNWPQITPVTDIDLVKTDINKGPWAMSLTPMQFCKKNNLLIEQRFGPEDGVARREWGRVEVSLNRGKSSRKFALQLGPLWSGVNKVPPHVRALFAVFSARINGDTDPALALLHHINISSVARLDFTGANELIKKYAETSIVKQVVSKHAYLLTVMAEMLVATRNDGVQGTADFLWLKPVDRRLWYMLNTVGRQTPFVEVAGPFAHWMAEKEAAHRLVVPMIDEATNALELSLTEIVYRPDDEGS